MGSGSDPEKWVLSVPDFSKVSIWRMIYQIIHFSQNGRIKNDVKNVFLVKNFFFFFFFFNGGLDTGSKEEEYGKSCFYSIENYPCCHH